MSQVHHEDLAIAYLSRARDSSDRFQDLLDPIIRDRELDFHLGQKIDHVFGTAVQLSVAFLTAETFDLGHSDSLNAEFAQALAHVIELEGFDDRCDQLHD